MREKELIKTKIDTDFNKNIVTVYVYKSFKVFLTKYDEIEKKDYTAEDLEQGFLQLIYDADINEQERFDVKIEDRQKTNYKKEKEDLIKDFTSEKPQIFLKKNFKISEDYESIKIDEKVYKIPDFFNKNTIKSKDAKTWEMIFIYIFNDKINKKVKILLKEPSPIFVEKLRKLKSVTDNEDA